jgi:hypothetical protein
MSQPGHACQREWEGGGERQPLPSGTYRGWYLYREDRCWMTMDLLVQEEAVTGTCHDDHGGLARIAGRSVARSGLVGFGKCYVEDDWVCVYSGRWNGRSIEGWWAFEASWQIDLMTRQGGPLRGRFSLWLVGG